ncbi:MAG: glycosyltransferase [Clostridia bacterium]
MKIAMVIDIYNDDGNGTSMSARHFVEKLEERGHQITILCQGDKKGKEGNVYYFNAIKVPYKIQEICEKQHAILAHPDDQLIREALLDVDVVHIYLPFWLGTHSSKIAKELGKPVLGCFHIAAENITYNLGLQNVPLVDTIVYKSFKNFHYNSINNIYCPSQSIADIIRENGYTQNIYIISNGYNPNFKQIKSIEKPDKYKDKFVIISVGRLTKEKRQDLIIKAIGNSLYKASIVLILAGKGGLKDSYQQLAEQCNVNIEFMFINQDELIKTLNYADIFVQASDVETESISCLEAIACGVVPIISNSKMCATRQFALDSSAIFEKDDYNNLADKIDNYISNPKRLKLLRNDYARSALNYSLENSIDSIIKVYNYIINNNGETGKTFNYNQTELTNMGDYINDIN